MRHMKASSSPPFFLGPSLRNRVMNVKDLRSILLTWFPFLLYERLLLDTKRPDWCHTLGWICPYVPKHLKP